MSESCKECRFFKAHKTEYDTFDNFGVIVRRTVEQTVCRRQPVFVPHEPTDWCGEFKCDPDFEVKPSKDEARVSVKASDVAAIKEFGRRLENAIGGDIPHFDSLITQGRCRAFFKVAEAL